MRICWRRYTTVRCCVCAESDDGHGDRGGTGADHAGQRYRFGGNATHRGTMVGGMVTAPLLSMFVVPAAYLLLRRRSYRASGRSGDNFGAGLTRKAAKRLTWSQVRRCGAIVPMALRASCTIIVITWLS